MIELKSSHFLSHIAKKSGRNVSRHDLQRFRSTWNGIGRKLDIEKNLDIVKIMP